MEWVDADVGLWRGRVGRELLAMCVGDAVLRMDCNSLWGFGNGLGELNGAISEEFGIGANDVEAENHTLVSNGGSDNMEISNGSVEDNKKGKKSGSGVEEKCCISKTLSRETVSNYFYMPISQAAKELNIGLTLLKKRCRELGIRRWPHRKLMSLESLIKNVQELGKNQGEGKIREAIKVLENERKLLLRTPDLQLDETTKRLRQALNPEGSFRCSDEACFIEMDPTLPPSQRFFPDLSNFDFPVSESSLTLLHADELISNGFLVPLFAQPIKSDSFNHATFI
nr:protein RKD1-like [Ipomoea batatas]